MRGTKKRDVGCPRKAPARRPKGLPRRPQDPPRQPRVPGAPPKRHRDSRAAPRPRHAAAQLPPKRGIIGSARQRILIVVTVPLAQLAPLQEPALLRQHAADHAGIAVAAAPPSGPAGRCGQRRGQRQPHRAGSDDLQPVAGAACGRLSAARPLGPGGRPPKAEIEEKPPKVQNPQKPYEQSPDILRIDCLDASMRRPPDVSTLSLRPGRSSRVVGS